jgi:hypothetical protein
VRRLKLVRVVNVKKKKKKKDLEEMRVGRLLSPVANTRLCLVP